MESLSYINVSCKTVKYSQVFYPFVATSPRFSAQAREQMCRMHEVGK